MNEKALVGTENFKNPEQKQRHGMQVFVAKKLEAFVLSSQRMADGNKETLLALLKDAKRRIGANGSVPLLRAKRLLVEIGAISLPRLNEMVMNAEIEYRATLPPEGSQKAELNKGLQ